MRELPTRNWNDAFVLVITPDAFLRGLGGEIVREFARLGLRSEESRVVQPGARELDALYEDVIANNGTWGTYRYRCVDALFGLGSCLATVLRDDGSGIGDLHERIQRFKGSGPLAEADPQSLRRRFRSVNSILSLIHTSATPAEAELDHTIFFRRDWMTTWEGAGAHTGTVPDPIDAAFAAAQLDRTGPSRETRGFHDVRRQFRGRLIVHLWEYLDAPLHKAVADGFERLGPGYTDDRELLDALCLHLRSRVDPQLVAALASPFTPSAPPLDADRLWKALTGAGILVDRWERAVLSTSQYFAPAGEE
jgi:nucleoside diphosphate kinase